VSRPVPYSNGIGYHPIDLFLAQGAVVLEPNYRGSAGYGEKFRSLNVRNLGIGDAWDVLSGIDRSCGRHRPIAIASARWAGARAATSRRFLTTKHSDRFRAISVGAGISNWMTYYVNTDIHPFTPSSTSRRRRGTIRNSTPDTSPMTYIKSAKTPTLIQHGDADQRVPPPNAFELYQGSRDQNVPDRARAVQGLRPSAQQAEGQSRRDAAAPGRVHQYLWPNATTSR
jgi:dipeptidyl aminopeptidase/acylaminoacyl peptidase